MDILIKFFKAIMDGIMNMPLIFWIFLIICIILELSYKKIIGYFGEFWVRQEIKKLPKDEYLIINDVMIINNNISHQIDHIIVSSHGIFVIETKQYNGYIVGNETDRKWKQNNKYYINNPLHQNYGHVKCLEEVLNLSNDKFIPIVCIPSRAKTKIKTKSHVLRLYNLNKIITSYHNNIINNKEEIYKRIISLNVKDRALRRNHVKEIKILIKNKKSENITKCPKCGGNLVKRSSTYGNFIGCSNYPKCKYIKK